MKPLLILLVILQLIMVLATLDMWYMDRKFYNDTYQGDGGSQSETKEEINV